MKGYKGMDKDMRCRGMQYEVGKSYHVEGYISACLNGLHFCARIADVFKYYGRQDGNRFFEVEATGEIKTDGNKSVTSDMTIIRELSEIEVNRAAYGYGYGNGYGNGNGNGYGNGYGNGNGNGYGDGYGYGNGYGDGYGNGYGDGDGNGYGYGNGNGYGNGDGNIQKILIYA